MRKYYCIHFLWMLVSRLFSCWIELRIPSVLDGVSSPSCESGVIKHNTNCQNSVEHKHYGPNQEGTSKTLLMLHLYTYQIYCSDTNIPAIPIPVPTHIDVTATFFPRCLSSVSAVTTCRAPVHPRGCPKALCCQLSFPQDQDTYIAPPRGFNFEGSIPSFSMQ